MKMTRDSLVRWLGLPLIAGLTVGNVIAQDVQPTQKKVTVVQVQSTSEIYEKSFVASVLPVKAAHFAVETAGRLTFIAEPGSHIRKGELLFKLDSELEKLNLQVSMAQQEQERARINYLEKQQQRLSALAKDDSISQSSLDEVIYQLSQSRHRLKELEVNATIERLRLERKEVRAPYDGLVAQKFLWVNEYAEIGADIIAFTSLQLTEASARIPFEVLADLKTGQTGLVIEGTKKQECRISGIVPVSYDSTRMGEVRLRCPEPLFIGGRVNILLTSAQQSQALVIQKDALLITARGNYLFRLNADSTVTLLKVELGRHIGELVEVLSGLEAGDKVVLQGVEGLEDGDSVALIEDSKQLQAAAN
jgi:membrane fusion protein (multidrug efflux system)